MMLRTSLPRLTLFDLDHTLLSGDSDVLWCEFLMAQGILDRASFAPRNIDMEARYKQGTVGVQEFADFYVGTLAGQSPAQWQAVRQQFLDEEIIPRIPQAARDLVQKHQATGDWVVMTTATNRFITELTAQHLGIADLLATEPALVQGVFTGHTQGTLNTREGKVTRLHAWLAEHGKALADFHTTAYSDSINDLPLLQAVNQPMAVDPDKQLAVVASQSGWPTLNIHP